MYDSCPFAQPVFFEGKTNDKAAFLNMPCKAWTCPLCGVKKRRDAKAMFRECLAELPEVYYFSVIRQQWNGAVGHRIRRKHGSYIRLCVLGETCVVVSTVAPVGIEFVTLTGLDAANRLCQALDDSPWNLQGNRISRSKSFRPAKVEKPVEWRPARHMTGVSIEHYIAFCKHMGLKPKKVRGQQSGLRGVIFDLGELTIREIIVAELAFRRGNADPVDADAAEPEHAAPCSEFASSFQRYAEYESCCDGYEPVAEDFDPFSDVASAIAGLAA